MVIKTKPDLTSSSSPQAIGSAGEKASWITFRGSATTLRIGDVNVTTTRGLAFSAAGLIEFPRIDFNQGMYDLGTIYVVGTGTLQILYGC